MTDLIKKFKQDLIQCLKKIQFALALATILISTNATYASDEFTECKYKCAEEYKACTREPGTSYYNSEPLTDDEIAACDEAASACDSSCQ